MGNLAPSRKKDWELTQAAFDLLLARLDADREEGAKKYELLRRKLVKFLGIWGCRFPEEPADETISRIARKLSEGEEIENLNAYAIRIAQLVHLEAIKLEIKQRRELNQRPPNEETFSERADDERRRECYRHCLESLPEGERELIEKYYEGPSAPDREALSEQLGKPLSSLRVTAFAYERNWDNVWRSV